MIGINDYQHFRPLNNAIRDAETLRDVLIERFQFEEGHTLSLLNEKATREHILDTLISFRDSLKEEDNFMLYFAGHGAMSPSGSQGYWIPVEAQQKESHYLSNSRVREVLQDFKAHHIYLMVDSCFSGSMILRDSGTAHQLLESYRSRRVLTSGRKQAVADGPIGGHSPFADCILTYLRQHTSRKISALELESHVQLNTPRSADQHPEASHIHGLGDQSGQFVFHPKRDEGRDWQQAQEAHTVAAYQQYLRVYPQGRHRETAHWHIACLTDTPTAYDTYIDQFPQGRYTQEALQKLRAAEERHAWTRAQRRNTLSGYREFLIQYPNSTFAEEAQRRRQQIRDQEAEPQAWQQAQSTHTPQSYQQYLDRFPNGLHAPDARRALRQLAEESETQRKAAAEAQRRKDAEARQAQQEAQAQKQKKAENQARFDKAFQQAKKAYDSGELKEALRHIEQALKYPTIDQPRAIRLRQIIQAELPSPTTRFWENKPLRYGSLGVLGALLLWIGVSQMGGGNSNTNPASSTQTAPLMNPARANDLETYIDPFAEIEMVLIPGGAFNMGSKEGEDDEQPVHKVSVDSFYLGRFEVNQAQWKKVMGNEPSDFENCPQCPVESVSWNDVQDFLEKLNQISPHTYRLPTEAEWEFAARGGNNAQSTSMPEVIRPMRWDGIGKTPEIRWRLGI